jgi:hypothetical protein
VRTQVDRGLTTVSRVDRPLWLNKKAGASHGALRRLLFVTAEPHSLGGGGRQRRGSRTGTWLWGLLLAKPHPRVTGHTYDGDKAATETKKAEIREGDRRRKAGGSVY